MKHKNRFPAGITAAIGMCVLILDAKTALLGAKEGVELCINAVIPSLFPFFVLSAILNANIIGKKLTLMRPMAALCGVPVGCESILLLGLLGGYPIGAQAIYDSYKSNNISAQAARRLLGFCSNAGPSFIFGIVAAQFTDKVTAWLIWGVHILSALLVGILLPHKENYDRAVIKESSIPVTKALEKALKAIATVCGWVILFRVIIAVLRRWFLWLLKTEYFMLFSGLLELTNGCCDLNAITSEGLRFMIACCLLSFGGVCVLLQTLSTVKELGLGMYIPGKILQALFSFMLSALIAFRKDMVYILPLMIGLLLAVLIPLLLYRKKSSSIIKKCVV